MIFSSALLLLAACELHWWFKALN